MVAGGCRQNGGFVVRVSRGCEGYTVRQPQAYKQKHDEVMQHVGQGLVEDMDKALSNQGPCLGHLTVPCHGTGSRSLTRLHSRRPQVSKHSQGSMSRLLSPEFGRSCTCTGALSTCNACCESPLRMESWTDHLTNNGTHHFARRMIELWMDRTLSDNSGCWAHRAAWKKAQARHTLVGQTTDAAAGKRSPHHNTVEAPA